MKAVTHAPARLIRVSTGRSSNGFFVFGDQGPKPERFMQFSKHCTWVDRRSTLRPGLQLMRLMLDWGQALAEQCKAKPQACRRMERGFDPDARGCLSRSWRASLPRLLQRVPFLTDALEALTLSF